MNKIKKLLLIISMLVFALIQIQGQNMENENIILNGGFELWSKDNNLWIKENLRPEKWEVSTYLFPQKKEDSRPGSAGIYSLQISPVNEKFFTRSSPKVLPNQTYFFSVWYKETDTDWKTTGIGLDFVLLWKNDAGSIIKREHFGVKTKPHWQNKKVEVTAPAYAKNIRIGLGTTREYKGGFILFDDVSLVPSGTASSPLPALDPPESLKLTAYQGEIELSWKAVKDTEVNWEVMVDEQVEKTISTNTYIKTGLTPGSMHSIKVRAVKGSVFSPYVEQKGTTRRMTKSKENVMRIPFLRTITPEGEHTGRFLKLYYDELASPKAKISYKVDGIPLFPKGDTLVLPEFQGSYKYFRLDIHIDEGEGREWEIVYPQLRVINANF